MADYVIKERLFLAGRIQSTAPPFSHPPYPARVHSSSERQNGTQIRKLPEGGGIQRERTPPVVKHTGRGRRKLNHGHRRAEPLCKARRRSR